MNGFLKRLLFHMLLYLVVTGILVGIVNMAAPGSIYSFSGAIGIGAAAVAFLTHLFWRKK